MPAESIRPDRSRTAAIAHVLVNQHAFTSQFIDFVSKTTIHFNGASDRSPKLSEKEPLKNGSTPWVRTIFKDKKDPYPLVVKVSLTTSVAK